MTSSAMEQDPFSAAAFPNFEDGDVTIILRATPHTQIRLRKTTLAAKSTWFDAQFEAIDKARQNEGAEGSKYQFKLISDSGPGLLNLILTPDEALLGSSNVIDGAASARQTHVKLEDGIIETDVKQEIKSEIKDSDDEQPLMKQIVIWDGYCNFFNAIHSEAPKLEPSNIDVALSQSEALVAVASYLGGLPAVRMHLSSNLMERRHSLYTAIAQDPVRWLNLSVHLRSKAIFSEALIHCAGGFPGMTRPTPASEICPEARKVVFEKAVTLDSWARRVELQLLTNTLRDKDSGNRVSPEYGRGSWLVVSLFRDWLSEQIRKLDRNPHPCQFAKIIRLLHKGGDGYLKTDDVDMQIDQVFGGACYNFWAEESLTQLKKWAKQVVAPLAKNNLMIDPESLQVPYLTCVEVDEKDYPWELE